MEAGASALEAAQWYLDGATEGLEAYLKTYRVTSHRLAERLTGQPRLYARLKDIVADVRPYEVEILRTVRELRTLAPKLPRVPIYIFVGVMGHGATVKEVKPEGGEQGPGVLIPIELVVLSDGQHPELAEPGQDRARLDNLIQFVAHELVHAAQVQYQGLERYRVLYREASRGNHLAYAVREGGADFLCYLATGRLRERHRFLLRHEAELWREFSKLLYEPVGAHRRWFSGTGERDPQRPARLGYAIGWSICRRYHETAPNKDQAILDILPANEEADFGRIAAPYRQLLAGA